MSIELNIVCIAGHLTRDVEMKKVGEATLAKFGLASNRTYKTASGEKKENVTFTEVEVWGNQAEPCGRFLAKGSGVIVKGSLEQDRWEDDSGAKRSKHKVRADTVQFLPRAAESTQDTSQAAPTQQPVAASVDDDSEPPF